MVVSDPPAHTRLRKLATVAFHPKKFVAMEGRIRELVDRYIDDYVASGQEDLIANFSFPLPATIICELIGAPVSDAEKIKTWSEDLSLVAFGAGGEARGDRHARATPRPGGDARLLRGPARARAGEPHGRGHDLEHPARRRLRRAAHRRRDEGHVRPDDLRRPRDDDEHDRRHRLPAAARTRTSSRCSRPIRSWPASRSRRACAPRARSRSCSAGWSRTPSCAARRSPPASGCSS